jgi:hypothetical protein
LARARRRPTTAAASNRHDAPEELALSCIQNFVATVSITYRKIRDQQRKTWLMVASTSASAISFSVPQV